MNGRLLGVAVLGLLSFPASLGAQAARPAAPKTSAPHPIKLALAPEGNQARFVVREQLARVELPSDAIGSTKAITGQIVLDGKGGADSVASRITVDLTTLTSDRANRDRWIKRNTLVTDSFPQTTLVVTGFQGLPATLPTSGTFTFMLLGSMTVHGVTAPTTWEVTATANGDDWTGTATTHVKFGTFNMVQPRVMMVLSIVDDLKLEYGFHFVREAPAKP